MTPKNASLHTSTRYEGGILIESLSLQVVTSELLRKFKINHDLLNLAAVKLP